MPTYVFSFRHKAGGPYTVLRDCQGREQAAQYARRYLEVALDEAAAVDAPASVSVAEEPPGAEPRWFGAWDWTPQDGWLWSPLD